MIQFPYELRRFIFSNLSPRELSTTLEECLTKAFGAIANLVSLQLLPPQFPKRLTFPNYYWTFDLLAAGTFRLKALRGAADPLHDLDAMIAFLSRQPDIKDLALGIPLGHSFTVELLPPSLLPQLSNCQLQDYSRPYQPLLQLVTSRPLVRLSIATHTLSLSNRLIDLPVVESVACCHETLLYLQLLDSQHTSPDDRPPAHRIAAISQGSPKLKYLHYLCPNNTIKDNHDTIAELAEALSRFTQLENLLLESYINRSDYEVSEDLIVAGQLFQSCATLKCVSFLGREARGSSIGRYSYRRIDGGKAVFEGDGILNSNA